MTLTQWPTYIPARGPPALEPPVREPRADASPAPAGGPDAAVRARLAALFRLLGDGTRLRIVLLLARRGEWNVTELCATLGMPQPTVSHHLGLLRMGAVVTNRRQGKLIYYRLDGCVSAAADGGVDIADRDFRVRIAPAGSPTEPQVPAAVPPATWPPPASPC